MGFYSFIKNDITDKINIDKIVEQAKLEVAHIAAQKLDSCETPVNSEFIKAALPKDTPEIVIEKRVKKINKLKMMCAEKRLKKLLS